MTRSLALFVVLLGFASAIAPLTRYAEVEKDSYIVVFNAEAPHLLSKSEVSQWLVSQGLKAEVTSSYFIKTDAIETSFRGFAATFDQSVLAALLENKVVKYIEENQIIRLPAMEQVESNETVGDATSVWGLDRIDQRCLPLTGDSSPCATGDSNCQGANSVVWVVDTGVRTTHKAFGGRATIAANYATGDASAYNGDCNGHGTHVAGSAAGTTYGLATKAAIRSVRVLNCQGSGTNANVIDGFNFVGNNQVSGKRNILSASLGGGSSTATNDAINSVATKGVIPIVAAGNDNANACNYSPASAANAITVGATAITGVATKVDSRSTFSNYGTCVNVFAPGTDILSAWYTSDTATNTISGTSMATPYVSGTVAIINTKNDPLTYSSVKTQITNYATSGVISNAGTGSPNLLVYDRWNDGTKTTC
jgi:serine protease